MSLLSISSFGISLGESTEHRATERRADSQAKLGKGKGRLAVLWKVGQLLKQLVGQQLLLPVEVE